MNTVDLDTITLDEGWHHSIRQGACLMEAVSYIAGEKFSDHTKCVSPVLGYYGRALNDRLSHENRQRLKPYIRRLIGTADDGQDDARRLLAADWAIRVATPRWMEAAGIGDHADSLRALPPITTWEAMSGARKVLRAARDEAYAARLRARTELRERVRQECEKRGMPAAAVAAADAAAATYADAAAAAAAAADADADFKTDAYWKIYYAVKAKLIPIYRDGVEGSEFARLRQVTNLEAIELLGRMIQPSAVDEQ